MKQTSKKRIWTKRFMWALLLSLVTGGLIMFHVWKAMGQNPKGNALESLNTSAQFQNGKFRRGYSILLTQPYVPGIPGPPDTR